MGFWMRSLHKNFQLMLEFFKASFFVLHFSYYTSMTYLMMLYVILLIMMMILLSTLSWSGILSAATIELASALESDLQDAMDWVRKRLVDFNAGKLQLVSFNRSNNTGGIDKENGWVYSWGKKHFLRCWGGISLLNYIGALTLFLLLKLPSRKWEPWFVLWSFFPLRLLCISVNLLYSHVWSTIVTSGLVLVLATSNC